jgi:hemolysin III
MGWLVVFAMCPLLHALTWYGIFWIALGGLFYTTGIVFYPDTERVLNNVFFILRKTR